MATRSRLLGPFGKRLDAFTRAAARIDDGDVEAVHQTRVASRRLREVLPILGLDRDSTARLGRRLRKITKQLGAVRELDVLVHTIEDLGRDVRYSAAALKQISAAIHPDRVAAYHHLSAKLSFEKIQRVARRLQRAAKPIESASEANRGRTTQRSGPAWEWALDARMVRRAASVRSAVEAAGTVYVPEPLHDVRIAVKKLRYARELDAEVRPRQGNRDVTALRAVQDLLGRLHDLEILIGRVRHEQASLSPPRLTAWRELDTLIHALEDDCRALHARYMRNRAKLIAIADRICDTKRHSALANRRAAS